MRALIVLALAASAVGCTRWSMDHHLNNAYRAYDRGDCARVMLELSQVDRTSRARPFIHPEVSLLRGQCLERQALYVDAAQTYQYLIQQYPATNMPIAPERACRPWKNLAICAAQKRPWPTR